jgi:hypothetical protein
LLADWLRIAVLVLALALGGRAVAHGSLDPGAINAVLSMASGCSPSWSLS